MINGVVCNGCKSVGTKLAGELEHMVCPICGGKLILQPGGEIHDSSTW